MGCACHNMAPAGVLRWVTLITPLFMVNFALGFNLTSKTWRGSSALAPKALSETGIAKTPRGSLLQPPGASPSPKTRGNLTLLVTTPLLYWGAASNLTCWGLPKPNISALFRATASGRVILFIFTPLKPQAVGKRIFPHPIPFRATSRTEGQRDRERHPAGSQPPGMAAVPLVPGSIVLAPGDKQEKSHRCWPWVGDAGWS